MRKYWFGLLTALALCLALLPGTAGAEEEADDLGPEVEYSLDGGTTWKDCDQLVNIIFDDYTNYKNATSVKVKLKRNITYDEYGATTLCFTGQNVEVDGNGHTIKRDSQCSTQIFAVGQSQENACLTLKNITIDGGAVWNGEDSATRTNSGLSVDGNAHLIYIEDKCQVILEAGTILQNNDITYYGGGVAIQVGGTLTMKAGSKILNNSSKGGGGGVCVYGGAFIMEGGEINGNAVPAPKVGGGGVVLTSGSSFKMSGGEIKGNYAGNNGGGVSSQGTFEMTGGSIVENQTTLGGGGVAILANSSRLAGGTVARNSITGSMGGGVLVHNGTLTVDGGLVVQGNLKANGEESNVYLNNGNKIWVEKDLGQGAQIGVSVPAGSAPTEGNPTEITNNLANPQYFFSDDTRYVVSMPAGGNVQLSLRVPSTVTFDLNPGVGVEPPETQKTNEYGKLVTLPEPTRDGYAFDGWFTERSGGTEITTDTVFDVDTTVFAHWIELYTVTFDAGDGVNAPEAQVTDEYGKLATLPEATKEGYTFNGWFTEETGGTEITTETAFNGDTTVFAHWLTNYTVTFVSDGEEVGTQTVADGKTAVRPADPSKGGYVFDGWFKEETCENAWSFETDTVTENVTLYAKWTEAPAPPPPPPVIRTYTVRFLDGGTELASVSVRRGNTVSPPEEPAKEGFLFGGWYKNLEEPAPYDFETPITADLTLYAKWALKPVDPGPDPGPGPDPEPPQPPDDEPSDRDDEDDDREPTRPDPSTTTTTTQDPDGTVTSVTTNRTTGETSTVTRAPNGSTVTVNRGKDGNVTSIRAEIPAQKGGGTIRLPVPAERGVELEVRVRGGGAAAVEIPVRGVTPGTVAVLISPDGTETVIRKTLLTGDGVVVTVRSSARLRLEDRGRTFTDVPAGGWKAEAAAFVSARELFNGTGPNTFSPDAPMTRAMLAAVLHNLEGNPAPAGSGGFADVPSGLWCADAVDWAAVQGIVDGYAGGLFRPDEPITREQLAVMLWRYAGRPAPSAGAALNFPDADAAGDYAREALLWAAEEGVLGGYADGRLNPKGAATRAQTARMLMNFMTR